MQHPPIKPGDIVRPCYNAIPNLLKQGELRPARLGEYMCVVFDVIDPGTLRVLTVTPAGQMLLLSIRSWIRVLP